MSSFDPANFLNTEFTDTFDTERIPVPEGEFQASLKDFKVRVTTSGKAVMDVFWIVSDSDVQNATGQAEPMVRQTIWLDITDGGALDGSKGKNIDLGKLRDALGQNQKGQVWSPGMLKGGVALVKVKHSIDQRDGETIQADVKSVTAI